MQNRSAVRPVMLPAMLLVFSAVLLLLVLSLLLPQPAAASAPSPLRQDDNAPAQQQVLERIDAVKAGVTPQRSTFNSDDGQWSSDDDADITRSFGPGVYHIRNDAKQLISWGTYSGKAVDFYAEVDAYQVAGPTDNEYGLIFRHQDDDNYYVFAISSEGYYRLDKQVDNQWQTVVDWVKADGINTGEQAHNLLGLLVEGDQIAMLANGQVLTTTTDMASDAPKGGGLALSVATHDTGGVEIAFEDFSLWPIGAGDAGVATPTPEETPVAVTTPDPQVITNTIAPIRAEQPDYTDDFRRASDRWPTSDGSDGSIAFRDRGLSFQVKSPNYALWSDNKEVAALNPGDMLVEADATSNGGQPNDTYGLMVRYTDSDNFYFFGISNLNTFSFWRVLKGQWTKLQDWTQDDAILSGEGVTNRLSVLAQGDAFTLLANDTPLAVVTDATHPAGGVGFYVQTYDQPGLDVTFDNLDVWVLSQGAPPEAGDDSALMAAQTRIEEVAAGAPGYSADFAADDGAWSLTEDADAPSTIANGALETTVNKSQWLAWAEYAEEMSDFMLEVDAAALSGDVPTEVGVVFRKQDADNFYFFAIDNSGRFSLWKKQDGNWVGLRDWEKSNLIDTETGAANKLAVLAQGDQLAASINGQVVAAVQDDSLAAGQLALATGTFEQSGGRSSFDNFKLWPVKP